MKKTLSFLANVFINGSFNPKKIHGYNASFISSSKLLSRKNKGFCIGKHNLSIKDSFKHAMIIGGSGVGKSTTVLLPSLFTMKGSFVIHDPSGELYTKSSNWLRRKGYQVQRLNFANPKTSIGFNPLERADTTGDINKLASLLIRSALGESKDVFWNIQGVSLLYMLMGITKNLKQKFCTLHTVRELLLLLKAEPERVDKIVSIISDSSLLNAYKAFIGYDPKLQTSIIATGLAALSLFADRAVAEVTSTDTFSFQNLRNQKIALFIQTPLQDQKYYQPLINIFFEQLFASLMKHLPNPNDLPVFLLIDEAASMFLPTLTIALANFRKYGVGIMLVLQDFEQLIDIYGRSQAKTIKTNCFAKLYFTGQTLTTAKEVEEILGKTSIIDELGREKIHPLMTNNNIRTLDPKNAILICGHYKPMLIKLRPYYLNRRWKVKAGVIK